MISGYFGPAERLPMPLVFVGLRIRTGGHGELAGGLPFVLDTGSTTSCLHPVDAIRALGIPLADLEQPAAWPRADPNQGIGGPGIYYPVPAEYLFRTAAGPYLVLLGVVRIAQPTPHNYDLPSILGWDVLERFRLVIERATGRVELHELDTPAGGARSSETTDASQEDIEAIWFGAWTAGREALALENTRLRGALGFAASVIKSGEPWTTTCEKMIGGALRRENSSAL